MDNNKFLEIFYEKVILPRYGDELELDNIRWKDHGKTDLDAWMHFFDDKNGREYALLYEDFPGNSFLDDQLTHEIIPVNGERSIKLTFGDNKEIPNVTGYFTLFREKSR